jgi:transposase
MHVAKIGRDLLVTIRVLKERDVANTQIARQLGVTEGTVRYRLKRMSANAPDGRGKPHLVEENGLADAVAEWWDNHQESLPDDRMPCVRDLYEYLVSEHEYPGSYKSVLKYIRQTYPPPKLRPFRRVETPPGVQSQSDWAEKTVDIADAGGVTKLNAFLMALAHSRRGAVVWSRRKDQLSWHLVHTKAYQRLKGIAAVNRIDNLKTGISNGAGPWGEINPQYRTYARQMRFHVDAHEPNSPEQKGKVERLVQTLDRLDLDNRHFNGIEDLQAYTDARLEALSKKRICPATGKTINESWLDEIPFLTPLPETLPEPFDAVKRCAVRRDCTISFEGRSYGVPFQYADRTVEVRGCAETVQVLDADTGAILIVHPRGTMERIIVPPSVYEGESTGRVDAPKPLGMMARKIQEIAEMPVEGRPVDLYAALAEVSR